MKSRVIDGAIVKRKAPAGRDDFADIYRGLPYYSFTKKLTDSSACIYDIKVGGVNRGLSSIASFVLARLKI